MMRAFGYRVVGIVTATGLVAGCAAVKGEMTVIAARSQRDAGDREAALRTLAEWSPQLAAARAQMARGEYEAAHQTLETWNVTEACGQFFDCVKEVSTVRSQLLKQVTVLQLVGMGHREVDQGAYARARSRFQQALGPDRESLTPVAFRQAKDGLCRAEYGLGNLDTARTACLEALRDPDSASEDTLTAVDAAIRERHGQEIEAALTRGDTRGAAAALARYERLPGAEPARVHEWQRRLVAREIETALDVSDVPRARQRFDAYRALPGADADASLWEKRIDVVQAVLDAQTLAKLGEEISAALDARDAERARSSLDAYSQVASSDREAVARWQAEIVSVVEADLAQAMREKQSLRAAQLLRFYRMQPGSNAQVIATSEGRVAALLEADVARAIAAGSPERAEEALSQYRELPSGQRDTAVRLERNLQALKAKVEAERRARAEEAFLKSIPRLVEKYGGVLLMDRAQFLQRVLSTITVLGAQFFSDAEIEGQTMQLWVGDPNSVSAPNLGHFANLADTFVVWCRCPGVTTVGVDMRHLGGGRYPMVQYRFDQRAGRSRLAR